MIIYKYTLEPDTLLDLPVGAKVLSVGVQGHYICMWAMVDPNAKTEKRRFRIFGTGCDEIIHPKS